MNAPPITVTVRAAATAGDWHSAGLLLDRYVSWMREHAHFDPFAVQPALALELDDLAHHYADPNRVLLLGFVDGRPVGTIAVHAHPDRTAELKRMYVGPPARGRGLADQLVGAAIDHALHTGCDSIWLETVRGAVDRAIAVYTRHGFTVDTAHPAELDIPGIVRLRRDRRRVVSTRTHDRSQRREAGTARHGTTTRRDGPTHIAQSRRRRRP